MNIYIYIYIYIYAINMNQFQLQQSAQTFDTTLSFMLFMQSSGN